MKGTDHFKRTIYMYLEQRAEEDALFAKKYRNPAKNMDECVTHILNYPKNYEKSNHLLRQRRHRDLRRNPITLDNYCDGWPYRGKRE